MDGELGDFTMSEGHGHPLVKEKYGEVIIIMQFVGLFIV
jgi:hypothetical protein